MCGRYTLTDPVAAVEDLFGLNPPEDADTQTAGGIWSPRFNIAPTQDVLIARVDTAEGKLEVGPAKWGLIPHWAKDQREGARMINARSETVAAKPAFRTSYRTRRCLVPADGFYEWLKKGPKDKQPHYIKMKDGSAYAYAGLWTKWRSPEGETVRSCTVLTTKPNELVAEVHDRMPVILSAGDYSAWLDPAVTDGDAVAHLLKPYPKEFMESYRVSRRVSKFQNDDPECIVPALPEEEQGSLPF